MSTVECPNCGSSVASASRFCPECGRPLVAGEDGTASYETRRRWWPPDGPLLVVLLIVAGGVILLAGGEWAWGLVVLLLAGIVFLSQREAERRAARLTVAALVSRLSAHREVVSARSRGQLELFRARRELAELEAERARTFGGLGRAVWDKDEPGTEAAKTALAGIVERLARKEAEIETLIEQTDERVRRAQAGVAATEKLESPEQPGIPEPYPPPDEGDPPEPPQIPEPTPPLIPEPSPDDPAPAPEHPPTPQAKAGRRRG